MPTGMSRCFLVIMGGVLLWTVATPRLKMRIFHQPTQYVIVSSSWNLTINMLSSFHQTRLRKVSLVRLVDLPLEILVDILSLLEWKDILCVRQVCLSYSELPHD